MKVRHTPKHQHLPKLFWRIPKWGKLIQYEGRIKLHRNSRLQLKVLVFKNNRDLVTFWREALGKDTLCRRTRGCVTPFGYELYRNVGQPNEEHVMMVDPRYFAVMGLIETECSTEVIVHECGHAAFAYAKRHARNLWVESNDYLPEEDVCYPLGKLTAHVNDLIHQWGLHDVPKRRNP